MSFYQEKCLSQKPSGRYISLEELQDDQPQITPLVGKIVSPLGAQVLVPVVLIEVVDVPIRRSSRQSKAPRRDPIEGYIVHKNHEVLILDKEEPTIYKAAMKSSNFELWLGAMKSKIESMYDNQVWNLVDLPKGARSIECK